MIRSVQRSIAMKLAAAVGLPSIAFALAVVLWLRHATGASAAADPAFRIAIGALLLFALAMAITYAIALRVVVGRPLQRLAAGLRRAREGDFLHRLPIETDDELGELAGDFNTALAAITDLHARRIEDAASMAAMQRELALKAQLEARVRDLTLLHDLGRTFASTLEPDALVRHLGELLGRERSFDAFEVLLADPATGELVVQLGQGPDAAAPGTRRPTGEAPLRRERGQALTLPMLVEGAPAGALSFFRRTETPFTEEERRLLASIASLAAMAIANARLHQEMVRLSLTDPLTGVANRRALFARLQLEVERCDRFPGDLALALVDVDHFKRLNDAFGHSAGDEILRDVAAVLTRGLRKVDLVARYGGEEFAVLLPGADVAAAHQVAEKLRAAVETIRVAPRGQPTSEQVTISVGVATCPRDAREVSALIDCADAALYAAKRAGRNAVRDHAAGMREHPGRKRDVTITAEVEPPRG